MKNMRQKQAKSKHSKIQKNSKLESYILNIIKSQLFKESNQTQTNNKIQKKQDNEVNNKQTFNIEKSKVRRNETQKSETEKNKIQKSEVQSGDVKNYNKTTIYNKNKNTSEPKHQLTTDFLIIGSGIAGLNLALKLSKKGKVTIITKTELKESNSYYAQGGIAAVLKDYDSFEKHIEDTMTAGHYHNDKNAVEILVKHAPQAIQDLKDLGVNFSDSQGREGGHSENRICHVGDYTGKVIIEKLIEAVGNYNKILGVQNAKEKIKLQNLNFKNHNNYLLTQKNYNKTLNKQYSQYTKENNNKNDYNSTNKNNTLHKIQILENCRATELIIQNKICTGIFAEYKSGPLHISAKKIILATGGLGQLFPKTTNPQIATGDGIKMAKEAELKLKDLQYVQFHPTALDYEQNESNLQIFKKTNSIPTTLNNKTNNLNATAHSPLFLISEAVRGEGAKLVNEKGEYFMHTKHKLKSLAPRDIVTEEIRKQQAQGNKTYLDSTHHTKEFLEKRFPKIYNKLQEIGIKMESDLIPITPAAHYSCGGIKVNLKGETNIKNLLACGEVSCTGVHGKNRLASNSLLEAMVFGNIIGKSLNK